MSSVILSHEVTLYHLLLKLFPHTKIQQNVKKTTNVKYPSTGAYVEFDIWIDRFNLAFEFQDAYHFAPIWYYHNTQQFINQKDSTKVLLARKNGINLITIPCWWKGSIENLAATIRFYCPDLIIDNNEIDNDYPINLNPPEDFFDSYSVPDIGELMLASFPINKFTIGNAKWWMGEKYDGWRCCWNPVQQKAYTRYGTELTAITSLVNFMPKNIYLDSELWFGRGQFAMTFFLMKGSFSIWNNFRMVTFDEPFVNELFEKRYQLLLQSISSDHPFNVVTWRVKAENDEKVESFVKSIIEEGGEGLIVQQAATMYERGRSLSVFKLKSTRGDQEAIVVDIEEDKSVVLQLPSTRYIRVPEERVQLQDTDNHINNENNSLKVGDIVTIEDNFSSPRRIVPSKASTIVRIRPDLTWSDVLSSYSKDRLFWNAASKMYTTHPAGFWNNENMKIFASDFAKDRNVDPNLPGTWYAIATEFRQSKRGSAILRKFSNNFADMLHTLFPGMIIDAGRLDDPKWFKVENRRHFFEEFAEKNGFDPQVSENWYKMAKESIAMLKRASSVLRYHKQSVTRALLDLFPNIGLDVNRLRGSLQMHYSAQQSISKSLWYSNVENRREFFEKYALEKQFDPQIAENWYNQAKETILTRKHAKKVISHHNNSLSRALVDLFPSIGLEKTVLLIRQSKWRLPENRRKFFENFALSQQFDPLVASLWYSQPETVLRQAKGAGAVLFFHQKSFCNALLDLFPEIGLDSEKLFFYQGLWHRSKTRRYWFEMYAREHKFDPTCEQWCLQFEDDIVQYKGAREVLSYHGGNVATALTDLFPELGLEQGKLQSSFANNPRNWISTKKRREFLENYAIESGFDPHNPENWYLQSTKKILAVKGITGILHYHGSITKSLLDLFPNIGLEKDRLQGNAPYSSHIERRHFFEAYAKEHDFDPLIPRDWYLQAEDKIVKSRKGARTVLSYHRNSVATALFDLFPEIGLEKVVLQINLAANNVKWSSIRKRKEFFESYAKANSFSPVDPTNWYLQSKEKLLAEKEILDVLHYHGNSVIIALLELFPNIGLNQSKLQHTYFWSDVETRVNFFKDIAAENGFDSLVAENWYTVSRDSILSYKDVTEVLYYHNNNIAAALIELFPHIGLNKSKLQIHLSPWISLENRRAYFEQYAKKNGFDPLVSENWYSQHPGKTRTQFIKAFNDGVLLHHNQSVPKALVDLFPELNLDIGILQRMKWK